MPDKIDRVLLALMLCVAISGGLYMVASSINRAAERCSPAEGTD